MGLVICAVGVHVESVAQADALELILVVVLVALSHRARTNIRFALGVL